MLLRKILSILSVLCSITLSCNVMALDIIPPLGDIGDYGAWITDANIGTFKDVTKGDLDEFQPSFVDTSSDFIPIDVKIGLKFMEALSSIDHVLQISLVRFVIIFLFLMYAFWVAIEAYQMIKSSTDYKTVIYDIIKKGLTIAVWVIILRYGPTKLFMMIVSPILSIGTYMSNIILDAVASMYNTSLPDSCAAIHNYVNTTNTNQLLVDSEAAANIMCLPSRISVFFYHATGTAFQWAKNGVTSANLTQIIVGIVAMVLFIQCILKYAFMTLGVVADLFLTLLMLPFTALAESMPKTQESNYFGQVYNGFLGLFNTKKLSAVLTTFINVAVYFVTLSIVIAICAALLSNTINNDGDFYLERAVITLLTGCIVLYLAKKADTLATQLGGSIDNTVGTTLAQSAKNVWNKTKSIKKLIIKTKS